jgi:hypothetical protein
MIEDEEGIVREMGSEREISGPAEPSVFRDAIFAVIREESRLKREGGTYSGALCHLGLGFHPLWNGAGAK